MDSFLAALVGVVSVPFLVLLAFLFYPEKLEKWWAIILGLLTHIRTSLHRRKVTHEIQGHVNDFVRRLRKRAPNILPEKLRIEWVEAGEDRSAFLDNDEVVLRMRRDDPHDTNFAHGVYLYVSETLLAKAKRYASPSQRDSLDLYTTSKVLEEERTSARTRFVDEYLHPKTSKGKGKVNNYIESYIVIDRANLYFPVLLQELEYLGEKVFGTRRDPEIIKEIDELIEFLKPIAGRKIGEESDLTYRGSYCKFGLVIVGKPAKLLTSIEPYEKYIRGQLASKGIETIYLLARAENKARLEELVDCFSEEYELVSKRKFSGIVKYHDHEESVRQILFVARRQDLPVIQNGSQDMLTSSSS